MQIPPNKWPQIQINKLREQLIYHLAHWKDQKTNQLHKKRMDKFMQVNKQTQIFKALPVYQQSES